MDGINLRNNYKGIIFAKYVVVRVIRELRDLRDMPKYFWYIYPFHSNSEYIILKYYFVTILQIMIDGGSF